ncbi:type I restriction enzyme S subunit [Clostridium punense]|uniref:Type I restriction enzyme S subunit n=5 Tax=Clostridium TaxID=1485 RepID=A0ABS4JYI0_9CLOT|nr:restriction endonuclease subunit S [Clostridium punense]MBP2020588.1 type I restriction enzyme S subunit [Clostridium punense]
MQYVRLGDICNIKSSKRIYQSEYCDVGVPFYRGKEISQLQRGEQIDVELFISRERFKEIKEKYGVVSKGDLLITSVGTIGNTWVSDGREFYYKDGNITQVESNENINTKFLSYLFQSDIIKKQYLKGTSGTAQVALTIEKLNKLVVPQIKLETQDKIVEVLDKAQQLIDKRKAQISKLDELVKSKFIEMFGDPFRNPMEWDKKQLKEIILLANNGLARRGNDKDGNIVLRLVELQDGYIDYNSPNRIKLTEAEKKRYFLKDGDFLFARVNGNPDYVGRCATYEDIGEKVYHNDHIIRVRLDNNVVNNDYVSTLLNSPYGKLQMKDKLKTSAGQYTINQTGISEIEIVIPPIELQKQFANFVNQVDKLKFEMEKSLEEMENNFNSLMQKAFNGELFN